MNTSHRKKRIWLSLLIAFVILTGVLLLYYRGRPLPVPMKDTLFPGVEYQRIVRLSPRPLMIHVLKVNVKTKKLQFMVTPPDRIKNATPLDARTTSQFLEEFDLDVAVNGDGFSPWWSLTPADYYPHIGDPVAPRGDAASRGLAYWRTAESVPTLHISSRNRLSFEAPANWFNAISGETRILIGGKVVEGLMDPEIHPRTAIGYSQNGKFLYIVVVDGRQPFYSEGMTLAELAQLMLDLGAYDAMNLDGGGSSTLVMRGSNGKPRILNSPIDLYIPGRERPVANHLGIYFKK